MAILHSPQLRVLGGMHDINWFPDGCMFYYAILLNDKPLHYAESSVISLRCGGKKDRGRAEEGETVRRSGGVWDVLQGYM